ncbi:DNA repair protein RecN [bacterium]|nr:DNA repair protein RecN [bacterium]
MLSTIHISRLALIDELKLDFQSGLTVVTGETGAGKSILIQAVSALLGEPLNRETVKTGSSAGSVEAEFTDVDVLLKLPRFRDLFLDIDSGEPIMIRREIQRRGRNRFLINDQVVRKSDFHWIAKQLLDVNSQHSHQLLLSANHHLKLLDEVLADDSALMTMITVWENWQKIDRDYCKLKTEIDEMNKRHQLIQYQMNEIDAAVLVEGEKEKLIEERQRLRYSEEIQQSLSDALKQLSFSPSGDNICESLAMIASFVQRAADRDLRLKPLAEQTESLNLIASDISGELSAAVDSVEISPERLNDVMERLHFLQQMEGKFQDDIAGIIQYRTRIEKEFLGFESQQMDLIRLEKQWLLACDEYMKADHVLSNFRKKSAQVVNKCIEGTLEKLGMEKSRFEVVFCQNQNFKDLLPGKISDCCKETGTDKVEFMISANPGVPLKSLSDVASGGELSRIMLALKQHLGKSREYQILVFDEVDTGIGGSVANAVAEQLRKLSQKRQLICVTHLPQIAVRGHHHLFVEKQSDDKNSTITMSYLSGQDRTYEIARMLSGDPQDSIAIEHAEKLLSEIS